MRTHRIIKAVCAEPYRVLFPLGLAGAALGLGVWIPHYLRPESFAYPAASHATLQIQGFLLCFIFGFLGTMLPKVVGVAPLGLARFLALTLGLILLMAAAIAGMGVTAQIIHLALLINFLGFMLARWPQRRADPPPYFLFIAGGLLADLVGTLLKLAVQAGIAGGGSYRLAALLQFQAFPLLLILGVGGFLLPKLFAGEVIDPARLLPSSTHLRGLLTATVVFLAGYFVEALLPFHPLSIRLGSGLRAAVWLWFLVSHIRLHRVTTKLPVWLGGARWSLWLMGAGMALPVLAPRYLLAWEHLTFVSGFLWLTITVATRVLTAHAGRLPLLEAGRRTMLALGLLIGLAALTRVTTDIWTGARALHLALAALFALLGLALWARRFLRLVARFPGDGK